MWSTARRMREWVIEEKNTLPRGKVFFRLGNGEDGEGLAQ